MITGSLDDCWIAGSLDDYWIMGSWDWIMGLDHGIIDHGTIGSLDAAPPAAQRLEYGDLVLNQAGIGGRRG